MGDSLLPIPAVWRPDKPQEDNPFHGTHTDSTGRGLATVYGETVVKPGRDQVPCQWSDLSDNNSGAVCPWHIRQLRNSMYRAWTVADDYKGKD